MLTRGELIEPLLIIFLLALLLLSAASGDSNNSEESEELPSGGNPDELPSYPEIDEELDEVYADQPSGPTSRPVSPQRTDWMPEGAGGDIGTPEATIDPGGDTDADFPSPGDSLPRDEPERDIDPPLQGTDPFTASLLHPRQISKGTDSPFVLRIYSRRAAVNSAIKKDRADLQADERVFETDLETGQKIKTSLSSSDLIFKPESVATTLSSRPWKVNIAGRPTEESRPELHMVILTITDPDSEETLQSERFLVNVVDYAFDHVSKPFVGNLVSAASGVGAVATYVLTLMGKFDATLGYTVGTTAAAIGAGFQMRLHRLFRAMVER